MQNALLHPVGMRYVVRIFNIHIKVFQYPVLDTVYPAVDSQFLSGVPSILNDRGVAYIRNLLNDIELTQQIDLLSLIFKLIDLVLVIAVDILDILKPVVYKAMLFIFHGGLNTAAAVMAADNDMFYL